MEYYAQKRKDSPRFLYRTFAVALAGATSEQERAHVVSAFSDTIATLTISGAWHNMKWCLPPALSAVLTSEEARTITSALERKRAARTDRLLSVFPLCSDEYSTSTAFLNAVFGTRRYPIIDRDTRIFTLGSCFARNIAHHLKAMGYQTTPFVQSEDLNSPFSNAQMLTVCRAPVNAQRAYVHHWIDILYPNHPKPAAAVADALDRLNDLRNLIEKSDVLVVTCGNVLDYFLSGQSDGTPLNSRVAPKFLSVSFKEDVDVRLDLTHKLKAAGADFRLGTHTEVTDSLASLYSSIRALNTRASVLLTLSPIPIDSALGLSNVASPSAIEVDCISKSLLRVAIHELLTANRHDHDLLYFPSFEIIRWIAPCFDSAVFGKEDASARHVSQEILTGVYDYFLRRFATLPAECITREVADLSSHSHRVCTTDGGSDSRWHRLVSRISQWF